MRELICIQCPLSCKLQVSGKPGQWQVEGNRCNRGREYAVEEVTDPRRTLTTTVSTCFREFPRLPVRTTGAIPLHQLDKVMQAANTVRVCRPVAPGQVVLADAGGTGVDLVATASMPQAGRWENGLADRWCWQKERPGRA